MGTTHSSPSSLDRFPRVPISLLSSIALLSISSSSYETLLFMVALLFAGSDSLLLLSFLFGSLEDKEEAREETACRRGR